MLTHEASSAVGLSGLSPVEVLSRWPQHVGLAAWWSGEPNAERRYTVLAVPGERADAIVPPPRQPCVPGPPRGGWIGVLGYELGNEFEPRARCRRGDRPRAMWMRWEDAWVFDHEARVWSRVGNPPGLGRPGPGSFHASGRRGVGAQDYAERVARVVEYIRAGDVYQANIAHRLEWDFSGSARGLFAALAKAAPRHGAYLEWDADGERRAVVSASPELFLSFDAESRRLVTRPMKGTRRAGPGAAEALRHSTKDRAELAMIVDLMRNDLGRVCEIGSVRVEEERTLEVHASGGLLQTTATVGGRLAAGRSLEDALRAMFPCGSVTGAPKIRAMQIIDELEPVARGPYCGSLGLITDAGDAELSVAIRTALVRGGRGPGRGDVARGTLQYSVGAGIVAESDPHGEWLETLDKAGVIEGAIRAGAGW
ncbi:MAG: anthranilate synthase component I family protein [Phycisphaerales bacterium]|nr:anthranilate synthase component I family protein [Phycisphaerales bacterium]